MGGFVAVKIGAQLLVRILGSLSFHVSAVAAKTYAEVTVRVGALRDRVVVLG